MLQRRAFSLQQGAVCLAQELDVAAAAVVAQQRALAQQLHVLGLRQAVADKLQSCLVPAVQLEHVATAVELGQFALEKRVAGAAVD